MLLVIWCRLAFREETAFLACFPYRLLTACWYLLFSLFGPNGPTLTTPQASEDPLKSKSPILMSQGSALHFVFFLRLKKQALLGGITLGTGWCQMGEEGIVLTPHLLLTVLPFLFDLTIKSSPVSMSDVYPRAAWGNDRLKKTFEKMCPSKPSTLIKPYFQWERKKKAKDLQALLIMKNAMKEQTSL